MTDISEVVPGLYIASRFYALEDLPRFSIPIDCAAALRDDDSRQNNAIMLLAMTVSDLKRPVVLICDAGRNRSAVVAARALILKGHSAISAVQMVRDAREGSLGRTGGALTNQTFVDYLMSCDEAREMAPPQEKARPKTGDPEQTFE